MDLKSTKTLGLQFWVVSISATGYRQLIETIINERKRLNRNMTQEKPSYNLEQIICLLEVSEYEKGAEWYIWYDKPTKLVWNYKLITAQRDRRERDWERQKQLVTQNLSRLFRRSRQVEMEKNCKNFYIACQKQTTYRTMRPFWKRKLQRHFFAVIFAIFIR